VKKIKSHLKTLGGKNFVFIIILRILDAILSLLSLSLIYPLTSYFLEREEFFNGVTEYLPMLSAYEESQKTLAVGGIIVGYLAFRYLFGIWALDLTVKFSVNQRFKWVNSLSNYYFSKDYLTLKSDKSGKLVSEWYNDTYNASMFLTLLIAIVNDLTFVLMFLVFIIVTNPLFGLWASVLFVVALGLYYLFKNKDLNRQSSKKVIFIQRTMSILTEIILHIRDVKIFQLYTIAKGQVKSATDELGEVFIANSKLSKKTILYTELFIICTVALIFLIIGFGVIDVNTLDISLMVLYVALGFRSMNYLTKVMTSFNKLKIEFGSFSDVSIRLKESMPVRAIVQPNSNKHKLKAIRLENFNFSFTEDKPIFKNLNLDIPLSKHILLVGDSGSGKSTFLDILVGLFTNHKGDISIIDINDEEVPYNINLFGYVSQSVGLFGRDFKECICGLHPFDKEKFEHILSLCDLEKVYQAQKEVFNITSFSGGERLRIALARAIYYERPIIILDESLASVEHTLEHKIIDGLKELRPGLSILQVAHERSDRTLADYRLKISEGKMTLQEVAT